MKVACNLSVSPLDLSNISQRKTKQTVRLLQLDKIVYSEYELVAELELEKQRTPDASVDLNFNNFSKMICHTAAKKLLPAVFFFKFKYSIL